MLDTLSALDGFSGLRHALAEIADQRGDWAGIPMPLDDQRLIVEPGYPKAQALMAIGEDARKDALAEIEAKERGATLRNVFYSSRWRCDILVGEEGGRIVWGKKAAVHSIDQQMSTLGASVAWGIEQEGRALQLLGQHVRHHQFRQYLLTGAFLESSPRSHLVYMFRKLRPTVALTMKDDRVRILASLCMHPIAYYARSWAGAMCPTDDVIAHLMLMRSDEPMLWRRSNQHPAHRPEAGL